MIELTPLIAPMPVRLWRVPLDREPSGPELAELSSAERARAGRFAFARDRRRYVASHCALRRILADWTGCAPGELEFREGLHGKPALHPALPACNFNLSHCEDVALVAVARDGDVGVDVELQRPVPDALRLAASNYTPREQRELRETPAGPARERAFLYGWTRKEACLKALGSGLSIDPSGFDAGLAPGPRVVRIAVGRESVAVLVRSFRHDGGVIGAVARLLRAEAQPLPLPSLGPLRA